MAQRSPGHLRPGLAAAVLILAVSALQIGAALHQEQHSLGDLGKSCAVCLHAQQLDHALPPAGMPALEIAPEIFDRPQTLVTAATAAPCRAYLGRAPPFYS